MQNGLRLGRFWVGLLLGISVGACKGDPPVSAGVRAAPRGYIAFCTREPQFCDGHGPSQVKLSGARWAELLKVNDTVNGRLKPAEDRPLAGTADDWEIPTGATAADCEDYVLAKKLELLALGWPGPALRVAIAESGAGRRHAVLVADTSKGLFVLDNLERRILRFGEAPYRWIELQVSTDPDRWESVSQIL